MSGILPILGHEELSAAEQTRIEIAHAGSPSSAMASSKQQAFAECLQDLQSVFDMHSQEFFLTDGTLLGCVREQKFIENDGDIDVGIFRHSLRPAALDALRRSPQFVRSRVLGKPEDSLEVSFMHRNGTPLDVMVFYPWSGEDMYYCPSFFGLCNDKPGGFCRWQRPVRGLEIVDFAGGQYKVPINAEEFLEWSYGPDWRTPKSFTYWEGLSGGYHNMV